MDQRQNRLEYLLQAQVRVEGIHAASGVSSVVGECAFFFFFLFGLFRAAPAAYGDPHAGGQIGAVAASLHHSHSNAIAELRL